MDLYSTAQDIFFLLIDMFAKVADFLDKPLLSQQHIKFLEDSQNLVLIGNMLDSLKSFLNVSNWGDITMLWVFTFGIVTVISVLFVKWILDWIL